MASEPNRATLRHIDRLFQRGTTIGLDEGQLLARFESDRDESALEALVDRHGPMVLGVCRRLLANPADVDDAFQATFLILVRKAHALRDIHQLGPWLHGVAYRVAVRARADAVRRRALEQHGSRPESVPEVHAPDRLAAQAELRTVLDQEIARLSSAQRTALVLCDLEGRSQQDAARHLGWSEGALRGRLARARRKLRDRLERRGVGPALLPVGAPLLSDIAGPRVSIALIESTTRAGMATVLAGRAAPSAGSVISTSVATLVQGVIHTMTLSKVKILGFAAILATVGLLAVGGFVRGGLARIERGGQPPTARAEETKTRTLDLHVVRRSDKQPIPGAMVNIARFDQGSWHGTALTTDAEGRCAIELPGGTVSMSIAIASDGYVPIR